MGLDQSFSELNQESTNRIRALVDRLSDEELQHPVGEHWTVAITLLHIAFWERRVMDILNKSEREGEVVIPTIDIVVNDLSLPLWTAVPPRAAAQIAVESVEAVDKRMEDFPSAILEELYALNERFVIRARHRNEHLDEVESALMG